MSDAGEKSHEATPRKLQQARERGEVPRAADLAAALALSGLLALALLPGGWLPLRIGALGQGLLAQAEPLSRAAFGGGVAVMGAVLAEIGRATAPLALLAPGLVILGMVALRVFVIASDRIKPKLSRIDPLGNARQKFGPSGLMEFAKSLVKLLIFSAVLWFFLVARIETLLGMIHQEPGVIAATMMGLLVQFLALVVAIMFAVGALDHLWQRFDHAQQQRMSHQELRDDHKQAEGDPHFKGLRRRRAQEIATRTMLADVAKANVVIVNPTHYAVALEWSPDAPHAPICVAKGVDETAARIRERAREAGVPIHSDPPTARALHATVELGQQISPQHFRAVAAAIRFADRMRARARGARR
jgi:flagellar biosynthetic protein FlhB